MTVAAHLNLGHLDVKVWGSFSHTRTPVWPLGAGKEESNGQGLPEDWESVDGGEPFL